MKIGRIYKIVCSISDDVYIGSTFDKLNNRFIKHKSNKKNRCCIKVLIDKYGKDKFKIILIKEYEFFDRKHMKAYEQLWINKLRCINLQNPFNPLKRESRLQYYKKNKEELNIKKRTRYINDFEYSQIIRENALTYHYKNKEVQNQKSREYYHKNNDILKEKYIEYRKKNKDIIKDKSNIYREINKDKLKNKAKMKITCECGCIINYSAKSLHVKSKKHLKATL